MRLIILLLFAHWSFALQSQEDSIPKSPGKSANFGPEITIGPEAQILFPNIVSFDLELRYWMRIVNWEKRRTFDHTPIVSPGFAYGRKEALFRLRIGDLLGITIASRSFRLGINAEWLRNSSNNIWSVQGHFGFRHGKLYYYLGVSQPFHTRHADVLLKTNMIFGIKYHLYNAYTYVN